MRSLGAHALLLAIMWGTLFVYSIHGALPFNPLKLPFERTLMVTRFVPQGWAFFTRNPREERLTLQQVLPGGQLAPLSRSPHARPDNAFGLDRRSRSQGVEIGLLLAAARE